MRKLRWHICQTRIEERRHELNQSFYNASALSPRGLYICLRVKFDGLRLICPNRYAKFPSWTSVERIVDARSFEVETFNFAGATWARETQPSTPLQRRENFRKSRKRGRTTNICPVELARAYYACGMCPAGSLEEETYLGFGKGVAEGKSAKCKSNYENEKKRKKKVESSSNLVWFIPFSRICNACTCFHINFLLQKCSAHAKLHVVLCWRVCVI